MEPTTNLKRFRNHYRLVLMNEDTFEEVVKFKLNRWSVYILLSTIFVVMVGLTAGLIIFTPLKYYLPGVGYGNAKQIKEYRDLKIKTDSMEKSLIQQKQYFENIQKILQGNVIAKDTVKLNLPKVKKSKF